MTILPYALGISLIAVTISMLLCLSDWLWAHQL